MRPATKQVLFLLALVLSLAALVAAVSWRLAEARREADATQNRPAPAPVSRAPLPYVASSKFCAVVLRNHRASDSDAAAGAETRRAAS